jgi:hypothetical protein
MKFALCVLTAAEAIPEFAYTIGGKLPAIVKPDALGNGVYMNSWSSSSSYENAGGKVTQELFHRASEQNGEHYKEVSGASSTLFGEGQLLKAEAGATGQFDGAAVADSVQQGGKGIPITTHLERGDVGALREDVRTMEERISKGLGRGAAQDAFLALEVGKQGR